MVRVIVLSGGNSDEREVSLRSGAAVVAGLEAAGYSVKALDTNCSDEDLANCDVVFPVLHGKGGEDGEIQARLERLGRRYVGSDSASSQLCMDKSAYRAMMTARDLLMPGGEIVSLKAYSEHPIAKKPHVLKPINGGSSVDTFIIRDISTIDKSATTKAFERHETLLLEELIVGTEVTVGVLGNEALPIIEIIPPQDEEFDYENKYNGKTQELIPAVHVSPEDQNAVQELALRAHMLAGCRDFSRSDFIISTDGRYYLLETNTIPGMTSQSLFPKMATAIGMDMPALCSNLVRMAIERN